MMTKNSFQRQGGGVDVPANGGMTAAPPSGGANPPLSMTNGNGPSGLMTQAPAGGPQNALGGLSAIGTGGPTGVMTPAPGSVPAPLAPPAGTLPPLSGGPQNVVDYAYGAPTHEHSTYPGLEGLGGAGPAPAAPTGPVQPESGGGQLTPMEMLARAGRMSEAAKGAQPLGG